METKKPRVTTIFFRTAEEWDRYIMAREILAENRSSPSNWFHDQVKALIATYANKKTRPPAS